MLTSDGSEVVMANPALYAQLVRRFARAGGVRVTNAGQRAKMGWEAVWDDNLGKARYSYRVLRTDGNTSGEQYHVCCPMCGDTRHRLYISHLWSGVYDATTKHAYDRHVLCFNENCFQDPANRETLYDLIWGDSTVPELTGVNIHHVGNLAHAVNQPVALPVDFKPLHELPASHPACEYLRDRHFDPAWLGRYLNVGYSKSPEPVYRYARNRIIIPVYSPEDKLLGWQARSIGAPLHDQPKYYSCNGFPRSLCFYNFGLAQKQAYIVVCEGPTDVWRYGPEAVASFGKIVTRAQQQLLASARRPVVLLLDGDVSDAEQQRAVSGLFGVPCSVIRLPPDRDPASYPDYELRSIVEANLPSV